LNSTKPVYCPVPLLLTGCIWKTPMKYVSWIEAWRWWLWVN